MEEDQDNQEFMSIGEGSRANITNNDFLSFDGSQLNVGNKGPKSKITKFSDRSHLMGSDAFHSFKDDSEVFEFGSQGGMDKVDNKMLDGMNNSGEEHLLSARVNRQMNRLGGSDNLIQFNQTTKFSPNSHDY